MQHRCAPPAAAAQAGPCGSRCVPAATPCRRLRTVRVAAKRSTAPAAVEATATASAATAVPVAESSEAVVLAVPPQQTAPAPAPQTGGFNGLSVAGMLAAAALGAGFVFSKLRRRGSIAGLEDRGYAHSSGGRSDPFMKDVMRNVNTVQVEELPPEIIEAARARRSRERANQRLDLEQVELPENHPWATRKPMSQDEEAAIQARLQVRPRRAAGGAGGAGEPRGRARQYGRE